MIAKCPKQVGFNKKGRYTWDNVKNDSDCEIYVSMEWIYSNGKWKNNGKTENWDRTLVQEG